MVALGTRFGDRYVLGPVLGWGGSSKVHQAHDERLGRDVALKIVHVDDDEALARLRREASVAARITSEHVIEILDTGTQPEPFVVMQLVTGRSLTEVVRDQGPLPPGALTDLARGLLEGTMAIHAVGVVHRDIAPGNVLISDAGMVKITDFGLARGEQDPTITDTGLVMGTASFVAPERRRGRAATPQSDLYEIGATLFYAATGQAPSESERLPDGLPIRPLLEQLLRGDPDQRPASAEEVLAEIPDSHRGASTALLTQTEDPAAATTRVIRPRESDAPDWWDRLQGLWSHERAPSLRVVLLAVIAVLAAAFVLAMPSADPNNPPAYDPSRAPAENAGELADWLREVTD